MDTNVVMLSGNIESRTLEYGNIDGQNFNNVKEENIVQKGGKIFLGRTKICTCKCKSKRHSQILNSVLPENMP